jgi:acetylornithine deacetylase/succinyl-diaminopimelate desuccinylase-like protein
LARTGLKAPVAITQPALNIRGLEAGHVEDKAQNAISTVAKASLDFRLVPSQRPEKIQAQVEQFITQQGFYIVRQAPDMETRRQHAKIVKLNWGPGYMPHALQWMIQRCVRLSAPWNRRSAGRS